MLTGCKPVVSDGDEEPDAGPSLNTRIPPAPLATDSPARPGSSVGLFGALRPDLSARGGLDDAGPPPPAPMEPERPIKAESRRRSSDESSGATLDVVFGWRDVPGAPDAPEVSKGGVEAARKQTRIAAQIVVSDVGRMRIDLVGSTFVLPAGTEIRARRDRYGHLLLWPGGEGYRVIAPGALRTLLGERRVDVMPLAPATPIEHEPGRRLDLETRVVSLASSFGTVTLELASVPEVGSGGTLVCRALLELAGIRPDVGACVAPEIPLAAKYDWESGGGFDYEAKRIARDASDLDDAELLVPPPDAKFRASGLPEAPGIFLSRDAFSAMRSSGADVAPPKGAPAEGFIASNRTDRLMYLVLDGTPVMSVPPLGERFAVGTRPGRYIAQWRTFLGDHVEPPSEVTLPARIAVGEPPEAEAEAADAGAPP